MTSGRFDSTATLLSDGRVLVAGGEDANRKVLASAELYDPATGKFTPTGSMAAARSMHTATLLLDGRVLIVGGFLACTSTCSPATTAELYDPLTGTFTTTGAPPATFAGYYAATLNDGRVLVLGFSRATRSAAAELYDPATGSFSATGATGGGLAALRSGYTVTSLRDGRVLVAGGYTYTAKDNHVISETAFVSAELYDPATGEWSAAGSMRHARQGATATLLTDGRVLIVGGCRGFTEAENGLMTEDQLWVRPAEIYDPSTGKFSETGSTDAPSRGCGDFTATLLLDGRVLIAGGFNGNAEPLYRAADLYDPQRGQFSATEHPLINRRNYQTATLLADGRVLIAGGMRNDISGAAVILSSAELYQP